MITIRPGSHVYRLLVTLSYVGELPMSSASLFGSEKTWRCLILKLSQPQEFRLPDGDERITCRMLTVNGTGRYKTIRLYKAALPILRRLDPDAYNYYMGAFNQHHFSGDGQQIDRHHRVAEAVLMLSAAGAETRPFVLPPLQNTTIRTTVPDVPAFYSGRELKDVGGDEENKTRFSRVVGAVYYPGGCHAVFNTRKEAMRWNGRGEGKVLDNLGQIARWNSNAATVDSAILFGTDYLAALQTLEAAHGNRKLDLRFDAIYDHIYFIPMDSNGVQMLRLLLSPDWNDRLLDLLFEPDDRAHTPGSIEYDAIVDGVYILSHLDGDITRLMRFREALKAFPYPSEILCYPFQVSFLKEYLGSGVRLKTLDIRQIVDRIGEDGLE